MHINHPLAYCFMSIAVLVSINVSAQSSTWELAKSKNGIQVYTRDSDESVVKEFKATTSVKLSLEQISLLFNNVADYPKWMANLSSCEVLKRINSNETLIYYTSELPWPIKDRDMVVRYVKSTDLDGSLLFHMNCEKNILDEHEDFLRINLASGFWKFSPNSSGSLDIIYQYLGDPGGSLPTWIINMFIVDGPFETLENLHNMEE